MKTLHATLATTTGAMMLAAAFTLTPTAAPVAADFSGKKILLVVPFKEGGGADRYGRLFQPFLAKHLPGQPTVLLVNKPGGGSVKAANWFERKAKPDGKTIFVAGSSTQTNFVFGGKKTKFNLLGWRPIVLSPNGTCFYIKSDTGITGKDPVADIKKLRARKWIVSGKNATSSELRAFLSFELLGIKNLTYLFGLSTGNRRKAFMRGEVDISYDTAPSCIKKVSKYVKKGKVAMFMTLGYWNPDGSIGRDPVYPNLYTVKDAYEALNGKKPSGPNWKALKSFIGLTVMAGKTIQLPKGTSDDIVNTYITAVKKTMKDPKFKKLSKRMIGGYPQLYGDAATAVLKEALTISPTTKKWMKGWIKENLKINI